MVPLLRILERWRLLVPLLRLLDYVVNVLVPLLRLPETEFGFGRHSFSCRL